MILTTLSYHQSYETITALMMRGLEKGGGCCVVWSFFEDGLFSGSRVAQRLTCIKGQSTGWAVGWHCVRRRLCTAQYSLEECLFPELTSMQPLGAVSQAETSAILLAVGSWRQLSSCWFSSRDGLVLIQNC